MIMGVSRNSSDYLWRREIGRIKMASTALKQMFKFILRIENGTAKVGENLLERDKEGG